MKQGSTCTPRIARSLLPGHAILPPGPALLRTITVAGVAAILLAGCASPLRYVDPEGKEHSGMLNPMMNSMTAQIDGKHYEGHFNVDMWGQSRATLAAANRETLFCKFIYRIQKVAGTCTTPMGRSYDFQSR